MILHSSQIILTALFLIWAFVVIKRINHIIDIKYRHLKNPKARVNHKYPGLTRDDYTNWSRFEMAFCGIFLFPVRVTLFFGSLIVFKAFLKILVLAFRIKDLETQVQQKHRADCYNFQSRRHLRCDLFFIYN